jgi:hypothetical protein
LAALGFSDLLSLVQSVVLIGALAVTLYFSHKQVQAQKDDLETRVLADIDEMHRTLSEKLMDDPSLLRVISKAPPSERPKERHIGYQVMFMCSYICHMRKRKVLGDNEWEGELKWMKTAFANGLVGKMWKDEKAEFLFDPSFIDFVNRELLPLAPG